MADIVLEWPPRPELLRQVKLLGGGVDQRVVQRAVEEERRRDVRVVNRDLERELEHAVRVAGAREEHRAVPRVDIVCMLF